MNRRILVRFALFALVAFAAPTASMAICPNSKPRVRPGGSIPPGLRPPADPPSTSPPDTPPPTTPPDLPPTTTPGDKPPPSTTPGSGGGGTTNPNTPPRDQGGTGGPPTKGPTTGSEPGNKDRGGRGPETLDDKTWEFWWGTNSGVLVPPIGASKADAQAAGYAEGRDPNVEAAMDAILAGLADPDDYVRTGAARTLASLKIPYRKDEQIAALRKAFTDEYREVREVAAIALARHGVTDIAETLRKTLKNPQAHDVTRGFAALALIEMRDAEGIQEAISIVRDGRASDIAGCVLIGLGATKDRQYTKVLLSSVDAQAGSVARARRIRCDAIIGLGKMGDPASIGELVGLLKDREKAIARSAAIALGGFKDDEKAYAGLRRFGVTADDPFVRAFSAVSLGRIGRLEAMPVLADLLKKDPEQAVRPFATFGIGLLGDPTGSLWLESPLKRSPKDGHFAAAAIAAGMIKATDREETLASALGGDPWAENYACLGLGLMGAKARVPAMRKELWITDSEVQMGAAVGCGYIDPAATADWLTRELKDARAFHKVIPLVDSISLVGTRNEIRDILDAMKTAPRHRVLRVDGFYAMARILNDHQPSWAYDLFAHTYYIYDNTILWHLTVFP